MLVRLDPYARRPPRLVHGKDYVVYGIEEGAYRLINEGDEPILYEPEDFTVIDDRLPSDWVSEDTPDGTLDVGPAESHVPGFYVDWHDGIPDALRVFERVERRVDDWHARLPPR